MNSSVSPLPVRLLGTGAYLPRERRDSDYFDQRLGKPAGWTRRHVGIEHRPYASDDETSSMMGAAAARQALENAGLGLDDIDVVVSACSVMEQAIPCNAALIHRQLGLSDRGIPAFDINATCLSFLSALDLMSTAIAAGRYQRVLIVASEIASAGLNWDDPDTAPLFGDGAAAVVLGADPSGESALLAASMETWSEGTEYCRVRAGGTRMRVTGDLETFRAASRFEMFGKPTYKLAAQKLPAFMQTLLQRAGLQLDQLQRIVPHQASAKALRHLELALQLPPQMLVRIIETHGNQMAASIPLALHHAITHGQIVRGDRIALIGSGAGLSLGGIVLRY